MTKLNNIVDKLIQELTGGEQYFDKLDEVLRDPNNFDIVQQLFSTLDNSCVIMSGKFGFYLLQLFDKGLIPAQSLIVVNGSLRNGEIKKIQMRNFIPNSRFTFVDDSFYKGRTRDKISKFIEDIGCSLEGTLVVYDGSINKDETVSSLFRYHL